MSILGDIQLALKNSSAALRRIESITNWDPTATELILANKKMDLKARYQELRESSLRENNLLYLLTNCKVDIPAAAYSMESVIWPKIPRTMTNNISQIMEHTRLRLEKLDSEINSL